MGVGWSPNARRSRRGRDSKKEKERYSSHDRKADNRSESTLVNNDMNERWDSGRDSRGKREAREKLAVLAPKISIRVQLHALSTSSSLNNSRAAKNI